MEEWQWLLFNEEYNFVEEQEAAADSAEEKSWLEVRHLGLDSRESIVSKIAFCVTSDE